MAINPSQRVINPKEAWKAESLTALPTSEIYSFSTCLAKDLSLMGLLEFSKASLVACLVINLDRKIYRYSC